MKIDSYSVQMAGTHHASTRTEVRETVKAWVGDRPAAPDENRPAPSVVALSAAARAAAEAAAPPPPVPESKAVADRFAPAEHDPVLFFLKLVIEAMTGVRVKTISNDDLPAEAPMPAAPANAAPARAGFGIEVERHEVRDETETASFRAQGVIRTADGKELRLDIALGMSRSYHDESHEVLRAGDAVRKDPLVINFDGTAAQLRSQRFSFDLDGDGRKEQVPLLAGNRGYLALDLNSNGKVDSGKELFGPASGNGFADLAKYDSDGNGWIDESDPVFAQLKVWIQDDKGVGTLDTLAAHGVGALCLGHADTGFTLKDAANRDLGQIRSTGLYLSENGSAGTLQQVDLVV